MWVTDHDIVLEVAISGLKTAAGSGISNGSPACFMFQSAVGGGEELG
jgi:hypothetical protein